MDLYAENILDHYHHPRGTGTLRSPAVRHREENVSCGDELTIDLTIAGGKIKQIAWRGTGCAISQASMSMLSEELAGMTVEKAEQLDQKNMIELLHVPVGARRMKCALLSLHTLKNALRTYAGRPVQDWNATMRNVKNSSRD
jgi:nitrogen fixation NifU-like protein